MLHLQAILPVFLLILAGYIFYYYEFPRSDFWPLAARITYFAFFPVLVFNRLSQANFSYEAFSSLFLAIALPLFLIAFLILSVNQLLRIPGPQFSSVFQGGIRFNTYIGLASSLAIYGSQGFLYAAITIAILIPIVNFFCVTILSIYGSKKNHDKLFINIAYSVLFNPLILASFFGVVVNVTSLPVPDMLRQTLNIFERAALPLGLLTVGAGLKLEEIRFNPKAIVLSSIYKLILFPLATVLAIYLFSIETKYAQIAFLFATLPTATSAYVLALEMGGDTRLMAAIITFQTLAALITMPLAAMIF